MKKNTVLVLTIMALGLVACNKLKKQPETLETIATYKFPVNFQPFIPKDIEGQVNDSLLVKFAWEEFLSLNWKSSYSENGKRDYPDANWNWTQDDPSLAVWETFAHRSELRPYSEIMLPFNTAPHYSFGDSLYPATPNTSFTLFNNLDENSEIGSCNLYAHEKKYGEDDMVLYQAKVNSDEYNFIKKHYPTSQDILNARANGGITLPKGNATQTGAVEIKTAWRLLVDGDKPADFFTRKAIYYRKSNDSIFYHNGTFALIGIHIIHKTEKAPDFVFATWEHVGVEKDDMAYVLLKNGKEEGGLHKNYKRFSPIPDLVKRANKSVHKQIKDKNENSIWKNYRLVGVQGKPTNDSSSMSYFLANYVIESDRTLANFHGSSISTPFDGMPNTTLNGQRYNMGGCMGCHGVAQSKGVDFSFLLDSIGKPIKEPDLLNHIPSDAEKGKLERYMESF